MGEGGSLVVRVGGGRGWIPRGEGWGPIRIRWSTPISLELSLESAQWGSTGVSACGLLETWGSRWPELQGVLGGWSRGGKSGREGSGQGRARLVLEKARLGSIHRKQKAVGS